MKNKTYLAVRIADAVLENRDLISSIKGLDIFIDEYKSAIERENKSDYYWSFEEQKNLLDYIIQGIRINIIAKRLKRSEGSIYSKLKYLGLSINDIKKLRSGSFENIKKKIINLENFLKE